MSDTNQIQIDGNNNLALQGINNSTVNITHASGPTVLPTELTTTLPKTDLAKIIGRERDLEQVRELLQQKQKVVVVNGLGGIGKTTLAQAYLTRYSGEYAHLLWVAQSEGDNFMLDLLNAPGLTLNLGIDTQGKDAPAIFTEIVARLKSIAADKPCLLVVDNANASLQGHFDHLPKPPHWHVLATSRERMERFYPKDLDFLSEADAVALFRQHCRRITDEADIKAVLKTIDYHTLTIEILAKTAQRHDTPLPTLKAAIERDLAAGVYVPHKGNRIERITSYLLSIFDLATLSEEEQRLLQHFAALPTEFVPYELLKTLIPEGEEGGIAPGLQDLADKGWLLSQTEPEAYKMHRIIQEVVKRKLPSTVTELKGLIAKVTNLLSIDQAKDNPVDKFPFIPYGEAILAIFPEESDEEISVLQNELALGLQSFGDYAGAKGLLEKALRNAEVNFGKNHPTTAIRYSNLAIVLKDLGNYVEAKTLLEKALRNAEVNFGKNHPTTAVRYSNLAIVLQSLGDYDRAKDLLEKAMYSDEANFGENHPITALRYSNLAIVLKDLGDYDRAKDLLEKAMRSNEANFGKNHPVTAIRYSNLALVLKALGDYNRAKVLLEKALHSNKSNFGENHPNTARGYSNLATAFQDLGDYSGAKELLKKAVQSDESNLGKYHPTTAIRYSNLALVLQDLGEFKEAFQLMFKAYQVMTGHFDKGHPYHQRITNNLNSLLEAMLKNGWTEEQIEKLKNA